jgi:hypothetical protein
MRVAVTALLLASGIALRISNAPTNVKRTEESTNFKAVVVHCDNRPFSDKDPRAVTIEDMSFVEMASMVDYAYSKKHGYEFNHYVLPPGSQASHSFYFPDQNAIRHSAWLKLLILKHAGNEHPNADLLLVHDSDTAVSDHGPSLSEFMDAFTLADYKDDEGDPNQPPPSTCTYHGDTSRLKQASGIWLNKGCKGHTMLARPGQQAWDILKRAWNYPHNSQEFPWEQAAWDYLADKTPGLLMIGGMNLTQQQCSASIDIPGFNKHVCHFQDDSFVMGAAGDRSARVRIRKSLGCGNDWKSKCLNNTEYRDQVSEHDLRHGQRKLTFLNMLRDLGYDDNDIYRLYRETRAKVAYFTGEDVTYVAAQLHDANQAYAKIHHEQNADTFKFKFRNLFKVADPIPEGSWERQCWCDGP